MSKVKKEGQSKVILRVGVDEIIQTGKEQKIIGENLEEITDKEKIIEEIDSRISSEDPVLGNFLKSMIGKGGNIKINIGTLGSKKRKRKKKKKKKEETELPRKKRKIEE